jgi:predicted permease
VLARLHPGITPAAAQTAIHGAVQAALGPSAAGRTFEVVGLRDQILGPVGPALRLLQGFAVLVLLIACANLANLLLARVSAREREFAVRAALGAGRAAVARVVLAEGALLALGGGAAGVLLAAWGRSALQVLAAGHVPLVERVALDGTALLFALGACVATTVAFGVAPALHAAAPGARAALAGGRGDAGTAGAARLRRALAAGQMALALVLLFGATLLLQSLARTLAVDNTGYDASRVVAADVALPGHPDERAFYSQLVARVRALPGVEAVGAIQSTPLTGKWTFREPLSLASGVDAAALAAPGSLVAFDYFRAMGVAVLAGRAFTAQDVVQEDADGGARTVIVNRTAARRLSPGASLVGRTVYVNGKPRTVVGIVEDTRDARLDAPAEPQWYAPAYFGTSQLVVRTAGEPARTVAAVRRVLLAADPRVVVGRVEPLGAIVSASVAERRVTARLLAAFAGVALALAAIGLYGVVSFGTARRRREFGVRTALGARPADVRRLVLGEGLRLSGWGIAAGLLAAVPVGLLLRGFLFDVSPADPLTLAAICGALVACALTASWGRRAAPHARTRSPRCAPTDDSRGRPPSCP